MALSPAALSEMRLNVLPQKAMVSPFVASLIDFVQFTKHRLKAAPSTIENTRRKALRLGVLPLAKVESKVKKLLAEKK